MTVFSERYLKIILEVSKFIPLGHLLLVEGSSNHAMRIFVEPLAFILTFTTCRLLHHQEIKYVFICKWILIYVLLVKGWHLRGHHASIVLVELLLLFLKLRHLLILEKLKLLLLLQLSL